MRILALIKRIMRQMIRDKRTLALMMVAPLFILTIVHFLFTSDESSEPTIGVYGVKDSFVSQLENQNLKVHVYPNHADIVKKIKEDQLDAFLIKEKDTWKITFSHADPTVTKVLQMKFKQVFAAEKSQESKAELMKLLQNQPPSVSQKYIQESAKVPTITVSYVYGDENTSYFDVLNPAFVGFFVFFFVFLISGIGLLRERVSGTLNRLLTTPIRRSEIVFGYLFGYGIFAVIQTCIVVFYAIKILGITMVGSIWGVIAINLVLALVALSLGILLSSFANSEFQMVQFIPVVVIPQIFFSGIIPVSGMADWLQVIAKFMPMYYAGDALQSVMYKGISLSELQSHLFALLGFAFFFLVVNIFTLKKYRTI